MKIIDRGLVGKKVQCPVCRCVFLLESADEWEENDNRDFMFDPARTFSVRCPQCARAVVLIEEVSVPKYPHGTSTTFRYVHFVD